MISLSSPVLVQKPGTHEFIKGNGFGAPDPRKVCLVITETYDSGILDNFWKNLTSRFLQQINEPVHLQYFSWATRSFPWNWTLIVTIAKSWRIRSFMQSPIRLRLCAIIAGWSVFLSPVLKMSLTRVLLLKLIAMMHGTLHIPRIAGTATSQDIMIYLLDAGILPSGAGTADLRTSIGLIWSTWQMMNL